MGDEELQYKQREDQGALHDEEGREGMGGQVRGGGDGEGNVHERKRL